MGYASNIIKGAGTGAAAGSAMGPWGALGGGVLGAVAGIFAASEEEENAEKKRQMLEQLKYDFGLQQDQIDGLIQAYYDDPESFLGTKEDVDAYRNALNSYKAEDYVYNFDPFNYNKTVDDFVTPYYDKIIDETTSKVQHSAAGAGVGRGTGAANAIASAAAQKEDELYKTALQQYNTDRAQTYSEWSGNIDKMQQRLNQLKSARDTQLNNLGTLANDYTNTRKQQFEDQINSAQQRASGNLQLGSLGLTI